MYQVSDDEMLVYVHCGRVRSGLAYAFVFLPFLGFSPASPLANIFACKASKSASLISYAAKYISCTSPQKTETTTDRYRFILFFNTFPPLSLCPFSLPLFLFQTPILPLERIQSPLPLPLSLEYYRRQSISSYPLILLPLARPLSLTTSLLP